jgi:hypothetical protein
MSSLEERNSIQNSFTAWHQSNLLIRGADGDCCTWLYSVTHTHTYTR